MCACACVLCVRACGRGLTDLRLVRPVCRGVVSLCEHNSFCLWARRWAAFLCVCLFCTISCSFSTRIDVWLLRRSFIVGKSCGTSRKGKRVEQCRKTRRKRYVACPGPVRSSRPACLLAWGVDYGATIGPALTVCVLGWLCD